MLPCWLQRCDTIHLGVDTGKPLEVMRVVALYFCAARELFVDRIVVEPAQPSLRLRRYGARPVADAIQGRVVVQKVQCSHATFFSLRRDWRAVSNE